MAEFVPTTWTSDSTNASTLGWTYSMPNIVSYRQFLVEDVPVPLTKEMKPMRSLYEVFVVRPSDDDVYTHLIVASSPETAKVKALLRFSESYGVEDVEDVEDYDVLVRPVGPVRPKTTKAEK